MKKLGIGKVYVLILSIIFILCSCKQTIKNDSALINQNQANEQKVTEKETNKKSKANKEVEQVKEVEEPEETRQIEEIGEIEEPIESKEVEYYNPDILVTDEDYVYYCNFGYYIDNEGKLQYDDKSKGAIIRYELKTGEKESIANVRVCVKTFILKDDLLFYIDNGNLFKMNLVDRTSKLIIDDMLNFEYGIFENNIIYINEEGKILKATLDGDIVQEIKIDKFVDLIRLKEDKIYYKLWDDDEDSLYCINIDGSENSKIINNANRPILTDNFIYYTQEDGLCKANLDGSSPQYITGRWDLFYKEAGNYIYYNTDNDMSRIDKKTGIIDTSIKGIHFYYIIEIGDYLYILDYPDQDSATYKKMNLKTFEITENTEIFF